MLPCVTIQDYHNYHNSSIGAERACGRHGQNNGSFSRADVAEPELSDKPTNQPISGYFIDGNQKNQSYKQTSLNILAIILEQLQPIRLTPGLPVTATPGVGGYSAKVAQSNEFWCIPRNWWCSCHSGEGRSLEDRIRGRPVTRRDLTKVPSFYGKCKMLVLIGVDIYDDQGTWLDKMSTPTCFLTCSMNLGFHVWLLKHILFRHHVVF